MLRQKYRFEMVYSIFDALRLFFSKAILLLLIIAPTPRLSALETIGQIEGNRFPLFNVEQIYDAVVFDGKCFIGTSEGLLVWTGSQIFSASELYPEVPWNEYWELLLSPDESKLYLFSSNSYAVCMNKGGEADVLNFYQKNGKRTFSHAGSKFMLDLLFVPVQKGTIIFKDNKEIGNFKNNFRSSPIFPANSIGQKIFLFDYYGFYQINFQTKDINYFPIPFKYNQKFAHNFRYETLDSGVVFQLEIEGSLCFFNFETQKYSLISSSGFFPKSKTGMLLSSLDSMVKEHAISNPISSFGRVERFNFHPSFTFFMGSNENSFVLFDQISVVQMPLKDARKVLFRNRDFELFLKGDEVGCRFVELNITKPLGKIIPGTNVYSKAYYLDSCFVLPGDSWYIFPINSHKPQVYSTEEISNFALGGGWEFSISGPLAITLGYPKNIFEGTNSLVATYNNAVGFIRIFHGKILFNFYPATLPKYFFKTSWRSGTLLYYEDENDGQCAYLPNEAFFHNFGPFPCNFFSKTIKSNPAFLYYLNDGFSIYCLNSNVVQIDRYGSPMWSLSLLDYNNLLHTSGSNQKGFFIEVLDQNFLLRLWPRQKRKYEIFPLSKDWIGQTPMAIWKDHLYTRIYSKNGYSNILFGGEFNLKKIEKATPSVLLNQKQISPNANLNMGYYDKLDLKSHFHFVFSSTPIIYSLKIEGFPIQTNEIGNFQISGLRPGTHKVEIWVNVQHADCQSKSFVFWLNVSPPWYLSGYFFVAIGFLAISVLWILFRYYSKIREKRLQREKRFYELELAAYQKSLNPHFVFNSLNTVYSFIQSGENNKATNFLVNFGTVLRSFLENLRSELIPIHEELALVEAYVELHKERYPNQLDFFVKNELQEEFHLNSQIPAGLIQVFVENCLVHAFPSYQTGQILISLNHLTKGSPNLKIVVQDNGIGIGKAVQKRIEMESEGFLNPSEIFGKRGSYGIKVLEERLKILKLRHGISVTLDIFDLCGEIRNGQGTMVIIQIDYGRNAL